MKKLYVLAAPFAVVAAIMAAPAMAQAAPDWFVEGVEVTTPVAVVSEGGESELATETSKITCSSVTDHGFVEAEGKDSDEVAFHGCHATGALEACEINEEIQTVPLATQLVEGGPSGVLNAFFPANGGLLFATIESKNCEPIPVEGNEGEPVLGVVEGEATIIEATSLHVGVEPATYRSTTVQKGAHGEKVTAG